MTSTPGDKFQLYVTKFKLHILLLQQDRFARIFQMKVEDSSQGQLAW